MAYFNHAFGKTFLGTGSTLESESVTLLNGTVLSDVSTDLGFVLNDGSIIPSYALNQLPSLGSTYNNGYFGFFDPKTNLLSELTNCCNVYLAGSAIYNNDKIGQFHGGYQETNKSKMINPKYVSDFYRVDPCAPSTNVIHIGTTPFTAGNETCSKEFLCNETYSLRVDIKGSPALRLLNHNAYLTVDAYTGCCAADSIAPTPVDSTTVFILWATQLFNSPIVGPFLEIVVQDETGVLWYAPGTSAAFLSANSVDTWDNYVSPGHTAGACGGMVLNGAYVDTKFGDCTFQVSDFYEKEPVKLYASMVDLNGDPCEFDGICVVTECEGSQVMGLGESVLRDLILSESYRQNFMSSDFRIREITQGNQIVNVIDRNALYTRYYLLHVVPRFNNPSGTFDNDRYLLEIITNGTIPSLETKVNTWLESCGTECAFEEFTCATDCASTTLFPSAG
jgi:hypothetical protein